MRPLVHGLEKRFRASFPGDREKCNKTLCPANAITFVG